MKDYSKGQFRKASFVGQDLRYSDFSHSDLRGTDFTGANLNGVDFTGVKTGMIPTHVAVIFILSFVISLVSGYVAMVDGKAVQELMLSKVPHERMAGSLTILLIILFVFYAWYQGGHMVVYRMVIPLVIFVLLCSLIVYLTKLASGRGLLLMGVSLALLVVLLVAGTVARVAAGSLSNVIFWVVAISGGLLGKTVGGGIGTIVLAVLCGMISKRALNRNSKFYLLKKIALHITARYGTSFRKTKMVGARFSQSKIRNADFSGTNVEVVNWGNARRLNCIVDQQIVSDKY